MKVLKNQALYQCEYCGKRLLSRNGAKLHEQSYCKNPDSPHQERIQEKQAKCAHENTDTVYRYIPGEAVQEPDYDVCVDCGIKM